MDCREVHKLIVRAQDARLPWLARLRARLHLAFCGACRNFERQMAFLRASCRRFPGRDGSS